MVDCIMQGFLPAPQLSDTVLELLVVIRIPRQLGHLLFIAPAAKFRRRLPLHRLAPVRWFQPKPAVLRVLPFHGCSAMEHGSLALPPTVAFAPPGVLRIKANRSAASSCSPGAGASSSSSAIVAPVQIMCTVQRGGIALMPWGSLPVATGHHLVQTAPFHVPAALQLEARRSADAP